MTLRSAFARTVIVVVVTAVSLEAVLQIAALGVWLYHRGDAAHATAGSRVILCVGDSYTFGMSASSPDSSYPARLGALLREGGYSGWTVVNAGYPGWDSREVTSDLKGRLAQLHPSIVYVLVGSSDFWTHPTAVSSANLSPTTSRAFVWRWRTGLLWSISAALVNRHRSVAASFSGARSGRGAGAIDAADSSANSFPVGAWIYVDDTLRIEPHGRMVVNDDTSHWTYDGRRLTIAIPGALASFRKQVIKGRTFLISTNLGRTVTLVSAAENRSNKRTLADSAENREGTAIIAAAFKDLRAQYESRQRPDSLAPELLEWADEAGEDAFADTLAQRILRSDTTNAEAWATDAWHAFQTGARAHARVAIDHAIRLAGDSLSRAAYLEKRARIRQPDDLADALSSAVAGYAIDHNRAILESLLLVEKRYDKKLADSVLAAATVSVAVRDSVDAILASARGETSGTAAVLAENYRALLKLIFDAGSQPVVLTYPVSIPDADATARRVAADLHVPVVNLRSAFDAKLAQEPRSALFAPDGHPNDAGYALMAWTVLQDAVKRVTGPS